MLRHAYRGASHLCDSRDVEVSLSLTAPGPPLLPSNFTGTCLLLLVLVPHYWPPYWNWSPFLALHPPPPTTGLPLLELVPLAGPALLPSLLTEARFLLLVLSHTTGIESPPSPLLVLAPLSGLP